MRYRYALIAFALAVLASVSCAACGRVASAAQKSTVDAHSVKARKKARSPSPSASGRRAQERAQQRAAQERLTAAVAPLIRADAGRVAVAVDDLTSGAEASYHGASEFATASIVKVDILATLLYELQQDGQTLTGPEEDLATTMIENSDNDAASALYADIGGPPGLNAANRVFGLTATTAGTDGEWGLTATTAGDQLRLLRQVTVTPSALSPASRDYVQELMGDVETGQRWGVPAAAGPGRGYLVKDGWLPNPSLWSINSIGEIVHDRHQLLVAVLSDGNPSEASGIAAVQAVAQAAANAMTAGAITSGR
jgi:beta-lactamase class A